MIADRLLAGSRIRVMSDTEQHVLATLLEPHFQSCKEPGALPGDESKAAFSGESQRPCHCHSSLFGSLHRLLGRAPESIYGTGEVIKVKVTVQY